jgi:protein-tyrosine phosphatase
MPKIENCSWADFQKGNHRISPLNAVAIQIVDLGDVPPQPLEDCFAKRYSFQFFDAEEPTQYFPESSLFSDSQAKMIARVLKQALDNQQDVLVHCVVGACRSGAVVEVGEIIGFDECHRYRLPNTRVKQKLMKQFDLLPRD